MKSGYNGRHDAGAGDGGREVTSRTARMNSRLAELGHILGQEWLRSLEQVNECRYEVLRAAFTEGA